MPNIFINFFFLYVYFKIISSIWFLLKDIFLVEGNTFQIIIMKLIFFIILSTFIYLSAGDCGSKCDRNKFPTNFSFPIPIIPHNSNMVKNNSNNYHAGGTISIINDCVFKIINFYVYPEINDAKWYCIKSFAEKRILLSEETVSTIEKESSKTITYDITKATSSCPVSLIDECQIISLMDDNNTIIASANVMKCKRKMNNMLHIWICFNKIIKE